MEEKVKVAQSVTKKKNKRTIITILVAIIVSSLLVWFALLWQDKYTLLAFCNAFWFAFAIEFFIAWIMFIYNKNVLSSLIHSIKTFGLMFVGKRTKRTYSEYMEHVEENQIPKIYYRVVFISASVVLMIGIVLLIIIEA